MGFLQRFHLVIRYKKGIHNKVVDMLSRPIRNASTILKHNSVMHESYIEQYAQDVYFKDVYRTLSHGKQVEDWIIMLRTNSCIIWQIYAFLKLKELT